jgi:flagellar hook-length control protein FliK
MMTIAIAHILAKPPTQVASTDNTAATDTPVAGVDFASLLLGQLTVGADLPQDISGNASATADANLLDAKILDTTAIDPEIANTTASPQDAAMLLAALGIPQTPPGRMTPTGDVAANEMADGILLVGGNKKASAFLPIDAPMHQQAGRQETVLATDSKTQVGQPVPLDLAEKAAKFAVPDFVEPKTDVLAAPIRPSESGTLPVLAATPPSNNAALIQNTSHRLDTPLRDASWPGDFAQKVVWLTSNDQKFAQITLNPPQMGPIEISLNINKDSASAYFVSPNAEVREAIETALPRLREMLAGVGIELGQANVSAQSSRQEAGQQEARHGTPRWIADEAILDGGSGQNQAIIAQRGSGLVDTFA